MPASAIGRCFAAWTWSSTGTHKRLNMTGLSQRAPIHLQSGSRSLALRTCAWMRTAIWSWKQRAARYGIGSLVSIRSWTGVAARSRADLCWRITGCASGGAYDKRRTLVIDPKLVYSTGFGGSGVIGETNSYLWEDSGAGIAVDQNGDAYVTGIAYSADFPLVNSLEAVPYDFYQAVFIAKLSADGSTLLYSTYVALNNDSRFALVPPRDSHRLERERLRNRKHRWRRFPDGGKQQPRHRRRLSRIPVGARSERRFAGFPDLWRQRPGCGNFHCAWTGW